MLSVPSSALACSVTSAGDPLEIAGDARPTTGNFRFGLEAEYLTADAESAEEPGATEALSQQTLRPVIVYSPLDQLNFVAQVPILRKRLDLVGAATPETLDNIGLGDVDIGARWFLWQSSAPEAHRWQSFALSGGSLLPTGPNDISEAGVRIDEHAQLGKGAFGPYLGVLYGFHQDPWDLSLNLSGRTYTTNSHNFRYGSALLWSARAKFRPLELVSFVLGLDGRYALQDLEDTGLLTNTGGLVLAAAPGVQVKLFGNLWLFASAQIPVYAALFGVQRVGPVFNASLQYSLM